jgi:16S rRNA processing protein RimM
MALVGRIARAHGIRGQVIIDPDTDFPDERFRPGVELFVARAGGMERLTLTSVRFHRHRPIAGIAGVETVSEATALAGCELRVPLERLARLPDGTYYRHDLIGCRVETTAGAPIGQVSEVEGDARSSRLVVSGAGGEVLIPLASAICRLVDVAGKRIVVEPIDGLLDLNA